MKSVAEIVHALLVLSDEERMEVFAKFCVHCGSERLPCHCWNDE